MSAGKAMAQVAHAVSLVSKPKDLTRYKNANQRTVIVLEGTASQILNLKTYLAERKIFSNYVIDEGVNEIESMSVTALATEQMNIEEKEARAMFRGFKLYKHKAFRG